MMNKDCVRCNIYKPGSAEYYKDQLFNIWAVAHDYDGYNQKNAKQMANLVQEIAMMAREALDSKELYVKPRDAKD